MKRASPCAASSIGTSRCGARQQLGRVGSCRYNRAIRHSPARRLAMAMGNCAAPHPFRDDGASLHYSSDCYCLSQQYMRFVISHLRLVRRGFSLLELLAVVTILGLIAAIILYRVTNV